jgi:hypothetical protein
MPAAVVRIDVPIEVVGRRLGGDPNASRADDLRVATADLAAASDEGAPPADWSVDGDRPVAAIAGEILDRLGWIG